MNNFNIYVLKDPSTDLVRYVGLTNNIIKRYSGHVREKTMSYKANWIKSLKLKGLKPSLEIIEDALTLDEAKKKEIEYIKLFKACGARLTNLSLGGEGSFGLKFSDERKKRQSETMIGKNTWSKGWKYTEEQKKRMSDSKMGRIVSEETRQKIRQTNLGQKRSEQARKNISEAHKGLSPWNKGLKNIYSPEALINMSKIHSNISDETRLKMRESHLGKPTWNKGLKNIYSEEARKKISDAGRGRICSQETRLKMSIFHKNRHRNPASYIKMVETKMKKKQAALELTTT